VQTYIAFLRGINVGGNALIKMQDLKLALSRELQEVTTYIQSGNVIFKSTSDDKQKLADTIKSSIQKNFKLDVDIAVFSKDEWQEIIDQAPRWWGKDAGWKHNMIIMIGPADIAETIKAIGELKPDIERVSPGRGVIYQSISWDQFGRTTSGKIASNPIYKKMTVRNYNTATKLAALAQTV
jgi:uncharacterized protein (DUF1697 family)